jgi:hypothetical protein
MTRLVSCATVDNRWYLYGEEPFRHYWRPAHCRDCGTPRGGRHHDGCVIAACEHGQAFGCPDCPDFDDKADQ